MDTENRLVVDRVRGWGGWEKWVNSFCFFLIFMFYFK